MSGYIRIFLAKCMGRSVSKPESCSKTLLLMTTSKRVRYLNFLHL